MNVRNQTEVGYQTSAPEAKSRGLSGKQFPGNKMPQGNKMEKKSVSKKEVSKMIKKSEKRDEKKDKKMMKKAAPKKKGMSMVSAERIEKYGKRHQRHE